MNKYFLTMLAVFHFSIMAQTHTKVILPVTSISNQESTVKTRSIEDTKAADAYARKADDLINKKKYKEAIEELKNAERTAPSIGWYSAKLGHAISWYSDSPDEAIAAFERSIQKNFDEPWVLRELGLAWKKKGNPDRAESYLQSAIAKAKELAKFYEKEDPIRSKNYLKEISNYEGFIADLLIMKYQYKKAFRITADSMKRSPSSDWMLQWARLRSSYFLGHEALGDRNYSEAVQYYQTAIHAAESVPSFQHYIKEWALREFVDLTEKRKNVIMNKNAIQHKIFVIYIKNTNIKFQGLDNKLYQTKGSIHEDHIPVHRMMQKALTVLVESMSQGNMTLTYDEDIIDATVTNIIPGRWGTIESRIPEWETIQPHQGELFKNSSVYDSLLIYWSGKGFATTANGGALNYPYVPFQLYGPRRGFMSIPSEWVDDGAINVLIHEFFHNIEALTNIQPTHGFETINKKNFPEWKGDSQLSYYQYHFAKTIPQVIGETEKGKNWKNMLWTLRSPETIKEETIQYNISVTENITLDNRKKAREITAKAWEQYSKNKDTALLMAKDALNLNPYEPGALHLKGTLLSERRNYEEAASVFEILVTVSPAPWSENHLAWIYMWHLKNYEKAVLHYSKAIALSPLSKDTEHSYIDLGRAYVELKKYNDAIATFDRCITMDPSSIRPTVSSQCNFWKGFVLGEKLNQPAAAIPYIRSAIDKGYNDQFTQYYYNKFIKSGENIATRDMPPELPERTAPQHEVKKNIVFDND